MNHTCWALSHLTDGANTATGSNIGTNANEAVVMLTSKDYIGIIPRLLVILNNEQEDSRTKVACLQILSNVLSSNEIEMGTGTDAGTSMGMGMDQFPVHDFVESMTKLLVMAGMELQVEALFLLSSIIEMWGTEFIQVLLSSQTFLPMFLRAMALCTREVKIECLWVIGSISSCGTEVQLQKLVKSNVIPYLCQNLEFYDPKTILMILDSIDNILIAGDRVGDDYRTIFHEYDGIEFIENLQTHLNDDVYRRAVEIIESHFGMSDHEDEDGADEDYGDNEAYDYRDVGRTW